MSNMSTDRLYNLLPAVYRSRDAAQGEPLRALLGVIESELEVIESDIDRLYDNWFIETCDDWVIPYIGDLLGVRPLNTNPGNGLSNLRAYVANTIAFRRRKGTASVLEQLARDGTGWPGSRVVEFFQRVSTTQHLDHVRPAHTGTLDLRSPRELELIEGPFSQANRTIDVRRIDDDVRYSLVNVGLFLWRLNSYFVDRGTARVVGDPVEGRLTFHPLGVDTPLFNRPQPETALTHMADEVNVPSPLRRYPLADELEGRRRALPDNSIDDATSQPGGYFGPDPKEHVLRVFRDGVAVPSSQIVIGNLATWRRPPAEPVNGDDADNQEWVAVDPVLGRLTFPEGQVPDRVEVSYAYGFNGDVGGGPYPRPDSVATPLDPAPVTFLIGVTQDEAALDEVADPNRLVPTLQDALTAWNTHVEDNPNAFGLVTIMDSRTYEEELTGQNRIEIPARTRLAIVAARWDVRIDPTEPGQPQRMAERLDSTGLRPHLRGNLSVHGIPETDDEGNGVKPGTLILEGLLLEGRVSVLVGDLGELQVNHCTVMPHEGGLGVNESSDNDTQNDRLQISLQRTICGPLSMPDTVPDLCMIESIVEAAEGEAINAPGARVQIEASTVFGTSSVRSLEASNVIFTDRVEVQQRQVGDVRFSYVPDGSPTPRRYRCQPDLVLTGVTDGQQLERIQARLRPRFTAEALVTPEGMAHSTYARLSRACAEEIRTGGDGGAEMGVFHHLQHPQREANVHAILEEYLPFGLAAGIFYVT